MPLARSERAALADLLHEVGPDRPTLCQGWLTGDLLAHLLIRERRPDAALGVFLPPLAGWTARVSAGYRKRPWVEQVELFRSGPPMYTPFGWGLLDEKANGMEMLVHHEDVRRGQPDWEPRILDEAAVDEVVRMATSSLVLRALRKRGVPVTARLTDAGQRDRPLILVPAKNREVFDVPAGVVLLGGVVDILLWLTGRSAVRIRFQGEPGDVAAVRADETKPAGR